MRLLGLLKHSLALFVTMLLHSVTKQSDLADNLDLNDFMITLVLCFFKLDLFSLYLAVL